MESRSDNEQSEWDQTKQFLEMKRQQVYGQLTQIKDRNVIIKQKLVNREADDGVEKSGPDSQMLKEKFIKGVDNQPKMKFFRDEKHQGDKSVPLNEFIIGMEP